MSARVTPWPHYRHRVARRPHGRLLFWTRRRGDSPAMKAALAAFEDHARRWNAARAATLAELGAGEPLCPAGRLNLSIAPTVTRRSPTGAVL